MNCLLFEEIFYVMFYICNFENIKKPFFVAIFFVCIHYCARSKNRIGNLNNLCVHFFRHVEKEETTSSL